LGSRNKYWIYQNIISGERSGDAPVSIGHYQEQGMAQIEPCPGSDPVSHDIPANGMRERRECQLPNEGWQLLFGNVQLVFLHVIIKTGPGHAGNPACFINVASAARNQIVQILQLHLIDEIRH